MSTDTTAPEENEQDVANRATWLGRAMRKEALDQAVKLHVDDDLEPVDVVATAKMFHDWITAGTVPAGDGGQPNVEVRWLDDEHIEIRVDDNVISEANFDENGSDGLLAVEKAAVGVARALGVEPVWNGPGRFAQNGGEA